MDTQIDWREELDDSFGRAPDVPAQLRDAVATVGGSGAGDGPGRGDPRGRHRAQTSRRRPPGPGHPFGRPRSEPCGRACAAQGRDFTLLSKRVNRLAALTTWVRLETIGNGKYTVAMPETDSGWLTFDQWLADGAGVILGTDRVSLVAIDNTGHLTPDDPGVEILEQVVEPELGA